MEEGCSCSDFRVSEPQLGDIHIYVHIEKGNQHYQFNNYLIVAVKGIQFMPQNFY